MQAIRAKWTNGQIVPAEPVDWPEGSDLLVEPVNGTEKIGIDESQWEDRPESLSDWENWLPTIEPMVWAEGEREEIERRRGEIRQYTIDAVGMQMERMRENFE